MEKLHNEIRKSCTAKIKNIIQWKWEILSNKNDKNHPMKIKIAINNIDLILTSKFLKNESYYVKQ